MAEIDSSIYMNRTPIQLGVLGTSFLAAKKQKDEQDAEERRLAMAQAAHDEQMRQYNQNYALNKAQDVREAAKAADDLAKSKLVQADVERSQKLEKLGAANAYNATIKDPRLQAIHYDEQVAPLYAELQGLQDKYQISTPYSEETPKAIEQFVGTNAQRLQERLANIKSETPTNWITKDLTDSSGKTKTFLVNPKPNKDGSVSKVEIGDAVPHPGNEPKLRPLPESAKNALNKNDETLKLIDQAEAEISNKGRGAGFIPNMLADFGNSIHNGLGSGILNWDDPKHAELRRILNILKGTAVFDAAGRTVTGREAKFTEYQPDSQKTTADLKGVLKKYKEYVQGITMGIASQHKGNGFQPDPLVDKYTPSDTYRGIQVNVPQRQIEQSAPQQQAQQAAPTQQEPILPSSEYAKQLEELEAKIEEKRLANKAKATKDSSGAR